MLIKEYRIPLPLSLEEYRIAQLYMIQKKSREESEGEESGVKIIENRPYADGPFGSGQYTYKVYYIGRHIPGWLRGLAPKTALEVHEESWNAYPNTRTKFTVPFVEKFKLEVDTVFTQDGGIQENIFNLSRSELRNRELDVIDIVNDSLSGSDYKEEEDPSLYRSTKTGRGPLAPDWIQSPPNGLIMCSYKLIKAEFRYWGLQSRIERLIHDYGLRRVMLRAHRQAWAWQDEWVGLTMEDIRRLEMETKLILEEKFGRLSEAAVDVNEEGEEREEVDEDHLTLSISSIGKQETSHSSRASTLMRDDKQSSLHNEESFMALETIAIHDEDDEEDSDIEEFFDAKEDVDQDDDDEDGEDYLDPLVEDLPYEGEAATPTSADNPLLQNDQDVLIMVIYGCDMWVESCNHGDDIYPSTLQSTFDRVYSTHYSNTHGKVYMRFIQCPMEVSSTCQQLVAMLKPMGVHDVGSFPVTTVPVMATDGPQYANHLDRMIQSINDSYHQFLSSEDGLHFNGRVSLLGDCLGAVLIYDILTHLSLENSFSSDDSVTIIKERVESHGGSTPSISFEGGVKPPDSALPFKVSNVFIFGSVLGLTLAMRKIRTGTDSVHPRPNCVNFYNLFYGTDPMAFRLEPLIDSAFSSIPPLLVPCYLKYPTGDQSSVDLWDTVSNHPHLFGSTHQLHPSAPVLSYKSSSTGCLINPLETPYGLKPFNLWWGDKRIDYMLESPVGVQRSSATLSDMVHAHILQSRYWEAAELSSFILRQVLQRPAGCITSPAAGTGSYWIPFVPPSSIIKWTKKKTTLKIQSMSPNHRAVDIVSPLVHPFPSITIQARFIYGPLNMAPLSSEMVDVFMLRGMSPEEALSWNYIETVTTNKRGRISYTLTGPQSPVIPGVYPLMFLVKGDHTLVNSNLFILPPHTEAVVFSIDGALCSNFTLSGRDMKIKDGSVQLTRLWQEKGYFIIYITGRPINQKEYITRWLSYHKFPLGAVSFSDSISTDVQANKLLYLARLIKEARVILCAAYGSQRHVAVYKELGLQPDQIYVLHGRQNTKKSLKEECQHLTDGFIGHLAAIDLRPANINTTDFTGLLDYGYLPILPDEPPTLVASHKAKKISS